MVFLLIIFYFNSGHGKMEDQKSSEQQVVLTVVFDNISFSPQLKPEWGYSCVIQTGKDTLLFDTGSNGKILLSNMSKLNIDPHSIKTVIISHAHWDHLGGLSDFLQVNPHVTVYIPYSFSKKIETGIVQTGANVVRVDSSREIVTDIFSLGELNEGIPEQSIALNIPTGVVIVTGCAHPGVVNIIKHAQSIFPDKPTYLTLGGFHLKVDNSGKIEQIVNSIKKLEVQNVAPSHCTGEKAMEIFKQTYQHNYIKSGVGKKIVISTK